MKTAKVKFEGISPLSWSKPVMVAANDKESKSDYEARTWKERLHYGDDGNVIIPAMAFKNCLSEAAKFLSIQIKGKGKATYTKHFEAGVMVTDNTPIAPMVSRDTVEGEWLFVPSDGKRGGDKRVEKCFPVIRKWSGEVTFYILDETITESVFKSHLEQAGSFIGVGRFRPRRNGIYGRFKITEFNWQ